MEFDLNKLKRDWIDGISGEEFCAKVVDYQQGLERLSSEESACGVLISETDPIEFAAGFFAVISLRIPIILANPNWGRREQAELRSLVSPAISLGRGFTCEDRGSEVPASRSHSAAGRLKAGLQPLPRGSILIPTGGSTGGVKLAIHTWDSLAAACGGVQSFLGGGPVNNCCVLPLYHVSGLMQLLRAYHSDGYIRFDEDEVAGACVSYVPTQLQRALADAERIQKLTTARVIFVGGAPMSDALVSRARALKLPVVPVYGMTETAAMVAAISAEAFLNQSGAGAQAIGDARIDIDPAGHIRIQSPALFRGYYGRAPIDLSQGYVTGDEGRLDQSGRLHVIGRMDRLIISGGEKIDPREVEAAVAKLEGVDEVLAVGLPDAEWGQRVVVYYTGVEVCDWKSQLQMQLVNYKIPKEMRWVDRLPLDEKGKFNVGASLVKTAEQRSQGGLNSGRTTAVFTSEAPTKIILPVRKTQNLRKGRTSTPRARYFITLCSKDRKPSLLDPGVAEAVLGVWRLQHVDGDYTFHCGTVMPDHIHFLFTLGDRISLGQCIIKFKAKTKAAIEAVGLKWQRDFYDHQLRADDAMEGFAKYMFLNPYRKSLLSADGEWPHWQLSHAYTPEFVQHLDDRGAPPEPWITDSMGVPKLIEIDIASGELT
ncbi:REP-associated tyrosine transposase [Coraliomargarita sp. W4R72]